MLWNHIIRKILNIRPVIMALAGNGEIKKTKGEFSMKKTVCFTGHRVLSESAKQLFSRLYTVLEKLVTEQGITDFYAGGAVGFDTIAAKCVLRLRDTLKEGAEVRLHLVLPCCNEDQTKNWTAEQKYEFRCILQRADSVEYTAQKHDPQCMGRRNAKLVEYATHYCVCYYDINHRSGTAQTVSLARQKGLQIINLFPAAKSPLPSVTV